MRVYQDQQWTICRSLVCTMFHVISRPLLSNTCINGHNTQSLYKFFATKSKIETHTRHFSNQFREIMSETSGVFPFKHNTMRRSPKSKDPLSSHALGLTGKESISFSQSSLKSSKKLNFARFASTWGMRTSLCQHILVKRLEKLPILTDQSQTARAGRLSRGLLLSHNNTQNHWLSEFTDMEPFSHPETCNKISVLMITNVVFLTFS